MNRAPPKALRKTQVILLAGVLMAAPLRIASADDVQPAWLHTLMSQLAAIPERQATFREEKRIAALESPLISQGRLIYRRPSHLEKITTTPDPEALVVDGDRLTLAGNNDAPKSLQLDRRPEIRALVDAVRGVLAGDLGLLESHYRITAEGSLAAWHLVMLPVDPGVRRLMRDIEVAGIGAEVRRLETIQTNGDAQIMTITTSQ